MTEFIYIECLISNALIYLTKERYITVRDLHIYRMAVQYNLNLNNIDAIITNDFKSKSNRFEDYFEIIRDKGVIILKNNISKQILYEHFVQNIPDDIAKSFVIVAENFKRI